MLTLNHLAPGRRAIVTQINPQNGTGQRLLSLGLIPGIELSVVQIAPLGDPIAIEFLGQRISLRRTEAEEVTIEISL
jgi:Fe2+ transport system protein FeoA